MVKIKMEYHEINTRRFSRVKTEAKDNYAHRTIKGNTRRRHKEGGVMDEPMACHA